MDSSNHTHHSHSYLNFTPSILIGFPPPISTPLNQSSVIDKVDIENNDINNKKKEIIHAYGCLELFADPSNVEELDYGNVVLYRLRAVHDVHDNDEESEEANSKINVYPSEGIISSFHRSSFVCIHLTHVHDSTHEAAHSERRMIAVQQLCLPGYEVLSLKSSLDGFNELWKRHESTSKSFFIGCSIDNQISSRVLNFFDVSHRRLSFSGSELLSLNSFGEDSFSSGSISSSNKDRKSPQTSKRHLGEKRSFPSSLEVIDEEEVEKKNGNVGGDESNKNEDNGEDNNHGSDDDDDSKSKDASEKSIDFIVRSSLTGEKRRVVLNGINESTTVRTLYEKVADDMDFDGESFVILLSGVTLDEEWKVEDIHLKDNDCLDIVIDEGNYVDGNSKSNELSKYDSLLEYKTPNHFKSVRFSLISGSELPERASLENLKSDMTLQRLIEKFFSTLSNEKFWEKSANKQIMDQERVIEGLKNENAKMYDEFSTRISQLMLEVEELKNERNQLKYELASAKTSSKSNNNADENDEQAGLSKRASVQSIPVEVTDDMHILNAESSTNSSLDNHFEVIALISPSWAIQFGTTTFDESVQPNKVFVNESDSSIVVHYKKEDGTEAERAYQVDRVHGQSDKVVFDLSNEMIDVIDSVLEGKNCSILFCGDSDSGKSLVMNGSVISKASSTKASSQPSSPLTTSNSSITKGMEGLLVHVVRKLFSCISSALASDGWSTGHQRSHQVILSFQVVGTNNKAIDVLLGYSGPGLVSHTPSSTTASEDGKQDSAASEPLPTAVEVNSAIECMNVIEQTNNRMKEQFPSLIGHKLITLTVVLPNEGKSNSSLPLSGEGKLQIVELIGTDKLQADPGLQSFSTIELDESKKTLWPKSSLAKNMISKTSLTTSLIVVLHPQQPQQAIDTLNFVENIRQVHID